MLSDDAAADAATGTLRESKHDRAARLADIERCRKASGRVGRTHTPTISPKSSPDTSDDRAYIGAFATSGEVDSDIDARSIVTAPDSVTRAIQRLCALDVRVRSGEALMPDERREYRELESELARIGAFAR